MTSLLYRGYELTGGQFAAIHICTPDDGYCVDVAPTIESATARVDEIHSNWRACIARNTSAEYRAAAFRAIRACGEFE